MTPEPRTNPILIGHEAAETTLADAVRGGRMHHAWLLTGPEGIGKATLAYRFAKSLLSGHAGSGTLAIDPSDPVARRIASGSHADLFTLQRTISPSTKKLRSEISIEDVRDAGEFLRLTPAEGGWRVVVVDRADELNRNAANALLKILEEPPSRALLLLVCAAPGRLPATLRSRCRRLPLRPLSDQAMTAVLQKLMPNATEDERTRLITLAEGSPGRALALAEKEGIELATLVDHVLSRLPDLPPAQAHEVADRIGRADSAFSTFMDLLRAALSAAVRAAARGAADPEQQRLASLRPLDAWGDVWHALTQLQDETEAFALDKRQAILRSLALLSEKVPGVV